MAELTFAPVSIDMGTLATASFAQANSGGGALAFLNRARHTSGVFISWKSLDSQDLAMTYCPGSPNPVDYSDFVVLGTYWEAG
jgi:hypothetical protein